MNNYHPIQTNSLSLSKKIKNLLWCGINVSLFRFTPSKLSIFRYWRVALVRVFGGNVDWTASLHPSAKIEYPWNLSMGKNSSLGAHSWTYAMTVISIGDNTCVGNDVYLLTGSHDVHSSNFSLVTKPIKIGNGVWVATRAMVLPGVVIGDMAVVAAGTILSKNVNNYEIVAGNPAKFIKKREITD